MNKQVLKANKLFLIARGMAEKDCWLVHSILFGPNARRSADARAVTYRSLKVGFRFSRNARIPSCASSVSAVAAMTSIA